MNLHNHREPWYRRFARSLGLNPESHEAQKALTGISKHSRARIKPRNFDRKRKARRLMAKESRRINRRT